MAEILEPPLDMSILRYNHHSLQGDVDAKRAILQAMGQKLEPRRKELCSNLEDQIFYLLNNLHIRHNNQTKEDKYYKEYISAMEKEELEQWYDELYQMILLAFLELDQIERSVRCKKLRMKIEEG